MKAVVHRRRRHADHVRAPVVGDQAGLLQPPQHAFRILAHGQRQLSPALVRIARREDFDALRGMLDPGFEVRGQAFGLGPQRLHARRLEQLQRSAQRGQTQDRRVGQLPGIRAGNGDERFLQVHPKAQLRIVAPPTAETRQRLVARVLFVDEATGDRSRSAVQVLVGAPDGEIDVPVVELQRDVPRGVSEVQAGHDPVLARRRNQPRDVVAAAGVVVHAAQQEHRDLGPALAEQDLDVLVVDRCGAVARAWNQDPLLRVEAVPSELRLHGVRVRGKSRRLHDDLETPGLRAVERDHHQVQVDGQAVHRHDFVRRRPDDPGQRVADQLVVGEPGRVLLEVGVDAHRAPSVQLLLDDVDRVTRHEPERVPAEVDRLVTRRGGWDAEPLAVPVQRIERVLLPGPRLAGVQSGHGSILPRL